MKKSDIIYVAGHKGMVGSAIYRALMKKGYENIIVKTHKELDLTNQQAVENFFKENRPDIVFLAAAKVGGIYANNTYRAQFIYENLMIQNNVIHSAYKYSTKKLLFLGSSCIYPKNAPQPIKEEYLLSDILEYTNEPYAIAKIAGLKMIESYNIQYKTNFMSVMPTNLFGTNDNYDLMNSHVLPAIIRKMHLAKNLSNNDFEQIKKDIFVRKVKDLSPTSSDKDIENVLNEFGIYKDRLILWGSGTPRREFLHCDELAEACIFLMENYNFSDLISNEKEIRNTHVNIGTGVDYSISEIATMVKEIVGFEGNIEWNTEIPDGTMRKLLDVSKINKLGWKAKGDFQEQLRKTYHEYLQTLIIANDEKMH